MNGELVKKIYDELKEKEEKGELGNNIGTFFQEKYKEIMLGSTSNTVNVYLAFYRFMHDSVSYRATLETLQWHEFFKNGIDVYFTKENIEKDFDEIVLNKDMLDVFFKFCSEDKKKNLYEVLNTKAKIGLYADAYNDIIQRLESEGIIKKNENNNVETFDVPNNIYKTSEQIKNEQEELLRRHEALERQKEEKRDIVFESATDKLGIEKEDLINKVGEDKSYNVDNIVVSQELINMLKSNESKAATVPNGIFQKIKSKVNKKRTLNKMELEVTKKNNITTLSLSKKETVFDKIATTSKSVVNKIKDSAQIALGIGFLAGNAAKEMMKEAIEKTDEKIKGASKKALDEIQNMKDKASGVIYNGIMSVSELPDKASEKVQKVKTDLAEEIHGIADKIDPNTNIESRLTSVPVKIVLNSGTYAGSIYMPKTVMTK